MSLAFKRKINKIHECKNCNHKDICKYQKTYEMYSVIDNCEDKECSVVIDIKCRFYSGYNYTIRRSGDDRSNIPIGEYDNYLSKKMMKALKLEPECVNINLKQSAKKSPNL